MPAAPQAGSEAVLGVGDILVTARRVSERVQDIPATVVAVGRENIERLGSLSDIQSQVSGVIFKNAGTTAMVGIRGFGNRQSLFANSTVGIFKDGVFVSPLLVSPLGRLDVERIEVAKGPQSTLYGRSSFTGAINTVSADPTSELSGYVDAGYGGSSVAGENLWHVRGVVSGPLSNTLSARLYLLREKRDGFTYDPITRNRGASYDRKIAQLRLLWEPTDTLTARLTGAIIRDNARKQDVTAGVIQNPLGQRIPFANPALGLLPTFGRNVWQANYVFPQVGKIKGETLTLDVRIDTPIGELASLSDFQDASTIVRNCSNCSRVGTVRGGIWSDERRYSQELRLSGDAGRLSYLAGGYYLHSNLDFQKPGADFLNYPQTTFTAGTTNFDVLNRTQQFQPGYTKTIAYAAFGQIGYDITDRLNLTVGLRQGHEKQSGTTSQYFLLRSGVVQTVVAPIFRSASFNATTGSANLSYKLAKDVMAYATYSRGDSPGGFNVGSAALVVFAPQKIEAYELGLKSQFFDRRLKLNIAAFDNRYKNLQLTRTFFINNALVAVTDNAGSSYGRGIDLDVVAAPTANWRFGLQYTHLKSKITRYRISAPPAPQVDFTGAPLVRSPKHTLNGSVTFITDVGSGKLRLTAEETYSSSYTNDYQGVAAGTAYPGRPGVPAGVTTSQVLSLAPTPGYALTNLSANYAFGNWEVSGFVRNLFNKQYIESVTGGTPTDHPIESPGEPRTWQMSVKYKF